MNGHDYSLLKRLEQTADRLGFQVTRSNHSHQNLCLMPKDDCLPMYSRDAEFGYNGTSEGCMGFLYGWQKALEYTSMLRLTDKDKIQKKEDLYRQERLLETLKNGKSKDSN
jgi:hypothetical protein